MNPMQHLLLAVIILLAIPIGSLLAKSTKEELKQGRRAFTSIMLAAIAIITVSLCLNFSYEEKVFLTAGMLFIFIISYISFKKSYETTKKGRKVKIRTKSRRKER